jgi:hypothetical protein
MLAAEKTSSMSERVIIERPPLQKILHFRPQRS